MSYLLVLLLAVPLVGAVAAAFMRSAQAARSWALIVCLATAAVALLCASQFDFYAGGVQLALKPTEGSALFLSQIGFSFSLGVNAIGMWLILLSVLLMPLAVIASFGSIKERPTEYYAWMLALLVAMLGVFVSRDVLLFYVFFELTLIPMYFIIGIWGGPAKREAAGKFFLFTFAGSVFTLAAAIYLGLQAGSFDIDTVIHYAQTQLPPTARFWVLLGFLAGFAVKVPLFPVHTWLPLAHTEAPTAGSVILAGVLLKLGTFGLIQLALPIGLVGADLEAVVAQGHIIPFVGIGAFDVTMGGVLRMIGVLCVVGVLYGALVAWVQQDIKKLVAYSSVSHLGFCVLGLVAMNDIGLQGSVLYMINHGISTGAMFLCIGMIYDRFHTRDINELSGLARKMPKLAFFFVLFVMSSIGLPATNGFVSEFLTVLGAFTSDALGIRFGVVAAIGVILGAVYMLHMTARVIWGPLKYPGHATHGDAHGGHGHGHAQTSHGQAADAHAHHDEAGDLTGREVGILIPLAIAVFVLGVYPNLILDSIRKPVQGILAAQHDVQQSPALAAAER